MKQIIIVTQEFVKRNMKGYDSGHDWWHIERVRKVALYINNFEKIADPLALEIAALLHDIVDSKFSGKDNEKGYVMVRKFLDEAGLSFMKEQVLNVIKNVSFSNKNPSGYLDDPVLHIIQDADRLDAIGAIGIARAFNYGGFRNNAIYIPGNVSEIKVKSTISHFYEKLLKLKDMMNTATGRNLADERHKFLEKYLEQFYKEWNF